MSSDPIQTWHRVLDEGNLELLDELLADEAVFHSPIVHTPQEGKPLAGMYLKAAYQVLVNQGGLSYVREIVSGNEAALEFTAEINGIHINGVDLVRWNEAGKIIDFKVMIRPLQAINLIHQMMQAMLQQGKS